MGSTRFALSRRSTKEPRSASSSRKNRVTPGQKVKSLRLPPGKLIQAQAMLIEGHSQRAIGRTLHMSEHTVAKVVRAADFQNFIKQQQEQLFGIAPIAIESFRTRVATDGNLAYAFLKDLGIIPSPAAMAQFMAAPTPADAGYERQIQMVSAVLLESHKNFGVDLPPGVEEALAKDAETQDAKTSQRKLLKK